MVKVNKDIDCVAVWYLDHSEDISWKEMSQYQQAHQNIVYFTKLLNEFRKIGLLQVKKITLDAWGVIYKNPSLIIKNNIVEMNVDTFDTIQNSEKVKSVQPTDVCSELYWINLFKEWSGEDFTFPTNVDLLGDTLLYRGGHKEWENNVLSLHLSLKGFYIKTYVTDWMPFQLDGVTPNIDYKSNFFRLRDTLANFSDTYGYVITGEITRFAVVDGLNISNHVNLEGERIGLDIDGNFLD